MNWDFALTDTHDYDWAMRQLFAAKWNIPQAVASLGMCASQKNWEALKVQFSDYCKLNPASYNLIKYQTVKTRDAAAGN